MNKAESTKKVTYTIFLEACGLGWAWVKDAGDETRFVGGEVADSYGWHGIPSISQDLEQDFINWYSEYGRVECGYVDESLEFNWDDFHERGFGLARRLKTELGSQAVVIYRKPCEDPSTQPEDAFEIDGDGTVRAIRLLSWCPI